MSEKPPDLHDAALAVCELFGRAWPRIVQDRRTLPLSDDDADRVQALRKALGWKRDGPAWAPEEATDWTADPATNRSNSAVLFERLVVETEHIIRRSAHDLIAGRADMVARLIIAQLAHKYGMRPPDPAWAPEESHADH